MSYYVLSLDVVLFLKPIKIRLFWYNEDASNKIKWKQCQH